MKKPFYHSIGVMSGTSLDGVDLVYVTFDQVKDYSFTIIHSETIPYSKKWIQKLKAAFYNNKIQLDNLDIKYGEYLSVLILEFIQKNNITKIDFIASHGHTIHHKPDEGYTLQIGNGQTIANRTKIKTICDFRTQDVALGGQGAPLVPIGDQLLFSKFKYCLNLGGFANISFNKNGERIAFDICPVNIVMNHYVNKLGFDYDNNGEIASSGNINQNLLDELNKLDFYTNKKPKSLGFEFVTETIFPIIDNYNLAVKDILRTFIEHIAYQISNKIEANGKILVTGGGVFNSFLIKRMNHYLKNEISIPNKTIIDFKEALVFSFLGLLRIEDQINCLKSVTGASKDHCSGYIFKPLIHQ